MQHNIKIKYKKLWSRSDPLVNRGSGDICQVIKAICDRVGNEKPEWDEIPHMHTYANPRTNARIMNMLKTLVKTWEER